MSSRSVSFVRSLNVYAANRRHMSIINRGWSLVWDFFQSLLAVVLSLNATPEMCIYRMQSEPRSQGHFSPYGIYVYVYISEGMVRLRKGCSGFRLDGFPVPWYIEWFVGFTNGIKCFENSRTISISGIRVERRLYDL